MKIGIIAAMEQELVLLVEQLENKVEEIVLGNIYYTCLLYTSPSPRDVEESRMPSSA